MAKKMTIVEQYNAIIGKVEGVLSKEEIDFLKERAELHAKKNGSRKMTAVQKANEDIKEKILNFMEKGKKYQVKDIQKAMGIETNQKASALIRQLRLAHLVIRTEEKGQALFEKV